MITYLVAKCNSDLTRFEKSRFFTDHVKLMEYCTNLAMRKGLDNLSDYYVVYICKNLNTFEFIPLSRYLGY